MKIKDAEWIVAQGADASMVPVFRRNFECTSPVATAWLEITAAGGYEARINGRRVSNYVLAPGWTEYDTRLQVQKYNITSMLQERNAKEKM